MDGYMVWLIILLVLGVVLSNLAVLKYSAKMKWPSKTSLTDVSGKDKKTASNDEDAERESTDKSDDAKR